MWQGTFVATVFKYFPRLQNAPEKHMALPFVCEYYTLSKDLETCVKLLARSTQVLCLLVLICICVIAYILISVRRLSVRVYSKEKEDVYQTTLQIMLQNHHNQSNSVLDRLIKVEARLTLIEDFVRVLQHCED